MCGRMTLKTPAEEIAEELGVLLEEIGELGPRYNLAPSEEVLAVLAAPERGAGARRAARLRWGLVPFFARDATGAAGRINARAETVFSTPMYRAAARERRCVVVADGFYEWRREGKAKRPYYYSLRDGRPFALAAVRERWTEPGGAPPLDSCAVITTGPNALVAPIHDRMPAILTGEDVARWIDPAERDEAALAALLRPCPAERMRARPVSPRVNDVRNDDPSCVEPWEPPAPGAPAERPPVARQRDLFDP